jgi:hypothetical protein
MERPGPFTAPLSISSAHLPSIHHSMGTNDATAETAPTSRSRNIRSTTLSRAQTDNLVAAHEHARRIGKPLNMSGSITLGLIPWAAELSPQNFWTRFSNGRLRQKLGRALAKDDPEAATTFSPTWLVVHETGDNRGEHVHFLLHVPRPLWEQDRTLIREALGGDELLRGALDLEPVRKDGGRALAYRLKECDPADYERLGIRPDWRGQKSLVVGKRAAVSNNLNHKARSAWEAERPLAGWQAGRRDTRRGSLRDPPPAGARHDRAGDIVGQVQNRPGRCSNAYQRKQQKFILYQCIDLVSGFRMQGYFTSNFGKTGG